MKTKTVSRGPLKKLFLAAVIVPLLAPVALQAQKSSVQARLKTERYNPSSELRQNEFREATGSAKMADTTGMACGQCKVVNITQSQWTHKFQKKLVTTATRHDCPACQSSVETVGHGKAKHKVLSHACGNSENATASCCSPKTAKGMTS